MTQPRFDYFVMFAEMRTGSNFLEANLNAVDGVTCHGEVFNPHFIGHKDRTEMFGIGLAARAADPIGLIRRMRERTDGLAGFRCFHDHDPRVIAHVLDDPRCAKIVLTRNPIESYVSWKIAQETGQWKLTNSKHLKQARVPFDAKEFESHLADLQAFQIRLLHALQVSGQTAFYIDYDDLQDLDVLNGLAAFLGVPARLAALDTGLKKQNPEEIAQKVTNPAAMEQALARMDRFNLSRTPNFEPRRGAAVPGFVAATAAPALFLPIKAGPEAQVQGWMSALSDAAGPLTGMSQKDLRQWKRAHPGHRSFTVLRHPVLRAHWAFATLILRGQFQEIRASLVKTYGLDLPPVEAVDDLTQDAQRAGFLGFLRFLKLNLSGQTGLRVDPHWATQSAVVQGFAQFQPPDLILREDRLAEGLGWLADELGIDAPALPDPAADPGPHPLVAIHDDTVETAAREAYQRDYMGFGFGPWRG